MRLVALSRVSTEKQDEEGYGLDAQDGRLLETIAQRGDTLVEVIREVRSGASRNRPDLDRAIELCESGQADGIIVTRLDRLSRSVTQFGPLLDRSRAKGWALVIIDFGIDTSTPLGEMMAYVGVAFAQFERRLISARTKEGLAVARAKGVRLGNAPRIDDVLAARIRDWRDAEGLSRQQIADRLNAMGVPTPAGGREWRPSSLRRVLA